VRSDARKASRGKRLFAVIVDSLLYLPMGIAWGVLAVSTDSNQSPMEADMSDGLSVTIVVCGLLAFGVFVVQLLMLHWHGWTIGKRLFRIRIVRTSGERAALGRIFCLRMLVPTLAACIPYGVGTVFSVVDALFIFRPDQRCLHDHIADTIVIEA
jgi:uncharacterized RDD family membrane protein YckC